jgi:hypothetical protein
MRTIKLIILLFGISLLFNSCKKKSDAFFAGKTDGVIYTDLEPGISFPSSNHKDSLDINQDSQYEFYFETKAVPSLSGYITLPAVKTTKDLSFLVTGEDSMPAALSSGEIISLPDKWCKTDTTMLLYYYRYITHDYSDTIGYWNKQKDKYLGFKYKNKLGWIKMSTTPGFIIQEIGLEQ